MRVQNHGLAALIALVVMTAVGLWFVFSAGANRDTAHGRQSAIRPLESGGSARPGGRQAAALASAAASEEAEDPGRAEVAVAPTEVADVPLETGAFEADALYGKAIDESGEPVADVEVTLLPGRGDLEDLEAPLAVTTTGANGRFRFRELVAFRSYRVHANPDGFLPKMGTLLPGHAHELELKRAVTVRGRVLDADSTTPIPGVRVSLRTQHWTADGYERSLTATSGDDGLYELAWAGLEGMQRFHVERPGHVFEVREFQVDEGRTDGYDIRLGSGRTVVAELYEHETGDPLPGLEVELARVQKLSTDDAGQIHVVLAEDQRSNDGAVAFDLRAEGWCRTSMWLGPDDERLNGTVRIPMSRGARILGRVTGAEGIPLAEANVWFDGGRDNRRPRIQGLPPGARFRDGGSRADTDDEGKFELSGLLARKAPVEVWASHESFSRGNSEQVVIDAAGQTAHVEVELSEGGVIQGKVLVDGEPEVRVVRWAGEGESGRIHSNDAGQYRFRGVPAGQVRMKVEAESEGWSRGRSEEWPDSVWVDEGETVEYDFLVRSNTSPITGIVRDELGLPIGDVTVYAWANVENGKNSQTDAKTSADGAFELEVEALPGILFEIGAYDGPRWTTAEGVPAGTSGLELVLSQLGKLALEVKDARSNEPVSGFHIYWRRAEEGGYRRLYQGARSFSPGPDGIFLAELPLGDVDIRVLARDKGYPPVERRALRVAAEPARAVEVELEKGATLEIVFTPEVEGSALPSQLRRGRVAIATEEQMGEQSSGGDFFWQEVWRSQAVRTNAEGHAKLRAIGAGKYRFLRIPRNIVVEPMEFDVPAVDEVTVEVVWKLKENKKGQGSN